MHRKLIRPITSVCVLLLLTICGAYRFAPLQAQSLGGSIQASLSASGLSYLSTAVGAANRTLASKLSDTLSALDFGAPATVALNANVSSTAGSAVITMSGASSANVGNVIVLFTPNTTNVFQSTIQSVSGSNVTLSSNADVTASGRTAYYGTDQTTMITAAWTAATTANKKLFLPTGTYFYNGPGLSGWATPKVYGEGGYASTIYLGANSYFVDDNAVWNGSRFSELGSTGGKGFARNRYTGANVWQQQTFKDLILSQYSACSISFNSSDVTYLTALYNTFYGLNTINSMGICINGSDHSNYTANAFLNNRVSMKLGLSGTSAQIAGNDFIEFSPNATPGSNGRVAIWLVPTTIQFSAYGLTIQGNKFGNENLDAADYRLLFADTVASSGSNYFGDTLWKTTASTGYIEGMNALDNSFIGNGAAAFYNPVIYSYVPPGNFHGSKITGAFSAIFPNYIVDFDATVSSGQGNQTVQIGPFVNNTSGPTNFALSNASGYVGLLSNTDLEGTTPCEQIGDTSSGATVKTFFGQYQNNLLFGINRNPCTGTVTAGAVTSAYYAQSVGVSTQSCHAFGTTATNGGTPAQVAQICNGLSVGTATDPGAGKMLASSAYQLTSGTGPTWTSGGAAPTGTCTNGSIFSRTDTGALYVCQSTAWVAK